MRRDMVRRPVAIATPRHYRPIVGGENVGMSPQHCQPRAPFHHASRPIDAEYCRAHVVEAHTARTYSLPAVAGSAMLRPWARFVAAHDRLAPGHRNKSERQLHSLIPHRVVGNRARRLPEDAASAEQAATPHLMLSTHFSRTSAAARATYVMHQAATTAYFAARAADSLLR